MPGEGSVYPLTVRRKNGEPMVRWVAAVTVGPRGQAKKYAAYLRQSEVRRLSAKRTPDQAERACRRATERLLETLLENVRTGNVGRKRAAPPTTLGAFLRGWHEVYVHGVGARQGANTKALIEGHIRSALGDVALPTLRPSDVEIALRDIRARLSSQTARHAYNLLAVALDAAVRDDLIPYNPVRRVKPPVVTKKPRQPWSVDEALKFFEYLRGDPTADPPRPLDRYYAAFVLAVVPGLRQGEILGLPWSAVDTVRLSVRVVDQLQRRDGRYVRVATKTRRESTRSIDEAVAAVLSAHKARQDAERPFVPIEDDGDGLVFVTEKGRPVNGTWLTHHFEKVAEAAKVPVIPFHALRHLAGTLMAAEDVSPKVAQDQLGHASVTTTLGIYTHTTTEQGREAARRVAARVKVAG